MRGKVECGMSLSDAQLAQVGEWIKNHNLMIICPMCADMAWEYADVVWLATGKKKNGELEVNHASHPMIPLVCTSCGYVSLLSARVIGLKGD